MNIHRRFLLLIVLGLTVNLVCSQTGTITNISVQPRTDGSGMVDVYFNLSGSAPAYNINLEVSFDAGSNWQPIPTAHLSGDITGISPGNNKHLVWDGFASFPNEYSTQTRLKIIAAAHTGGGIPGEGVTDIDGNFYPSIIIGNQEWMTENLRVTKYNNGDSITTGLSNAEWANTTDGAYAIYSHSQIDGLGSYGQVADAYGKLYNWYAVDDERGLCPSDWHVPTYADWMDLTDYVVAQGFPNEWNNPNGAGNALKSCRQVSSPLGGDCATSEHPRWDSHSTHSGFDEFDFSALPGGYRGTNGSYGLLGNIGFWWSSTESPSLGAESWNLFSSGGSADSDGYHPKGLGYSVRCVRDMEPDLPENFSLNLEVSPAGSGQVGGMGSYLEGATVSINAAPNQGYQFVNWTGDSYLLDNPDSSATTLTMPGYDVNLTANFSVNTYDIQASASPADGGSVSGAGTYSHGETAVLTATAADGYYFTYWRENGNVVANQPEYSFTVTENRNLTAHFAQETFTITLTPNPIFGGITTGTGNYLYGDFVTAGALPNPGFYFVNWTEDGNVFSNEPEYSFIVTGNRNLTAQFENLVTIEASVWPEGVAIIEGAGNYPVGQVVQLEAIPVNDDYIFVEWIENGSYISNENPLIFEAQHDRYLVAAFLHVSKMELEE